MYDMPYTVSEECNAKHLLPKNLPFLSGVPNKIAQAGLKSLGLSYYSNQTPTDGMLTKEKKLPVIEVPPDIDEQHLKAVKADDAQIETWIWDERVLKKFPHVEYSKITTEALNIIRKALLRTWKGEYGKVFFNFCEIVMEMIG